MSDLTLKPRNQFGRNFIESVENILNDLRLKRKWEEQLAFLNSIKETISNEYEYPTRVRVHVNDDLWMIEIATDSTKDRASSLYFGTGYVKGILSGEKPLSEWKQKYVIKNVSPETVWKFYESNIDSPNILIHMLTHFDKGWPWGSFSADMDTFFVSLHSDGNYGLYEIDEAGNKTLIAKDNFQDIVLYYLQLPRRFQPNLNYVIAPLDGQSIS